MSLTLNADDKLEGVRSKIEELLTAHNVGTPIVQKHVTGHMINQSSKYDFDQIFGKPVFWARVAPVDLVLQPTLENALEGGPGTGRLVEAIDYRVILQYQFEESDIYEGSTQQKFNDLLLGKDPKGLLSYFNGAGGFEIFPGSGDSQVVETKPPASIVIPDFPVSAFGNRDLFVHYAEFTIIIT
jgi:hypothetical protein